MFDEAVDNDAVIDMEGLKRFQCGRPPGTMASIETGERRRQVKNWRGER